MDRREYAVGAEFIRKGVVSFRVWAPASEKVSVVCSHNCDLSDSEVIALEREPNGYFHAEVDDIEPSSYYCYRLTTGDFPDPASRSQPLGPHGPSQVIESRSFSWSDQPWRGIPNDAHILYEMHVGTMGGTWEAVGNWLPHIARLGVTTLEIMPVAEFPGEFGWGYDGVNLFAPTRLYGSPDEFREFVDKAHGLNLGVILDVVYNHFGPDGNYLREFSRDYFSDRYKNEWGEPLNFDGPGSDSVREFFIENARYWIKEFHLDGLRFDATQQIFDSSASHILKEIGVAARRAAEGRSIFLVAENETQEARYVRSIDQGGIGFDAIWNDDFHHAAKVALVGRRDAYYSDYSGSPQEFVSIAKYGFLFQGQRCTWQKKARGTPSLDVDPHRFVTFIQNHDQVANSLSGKRIHKLSSPSALRAMTALLLLGPGLPMLFYGQEFAASAPFVYFSDHHPELANAVREGRRKFLEQFPNIARVNLESLLPDPESLEVFRQCQLRSEDTTENNMMLRLHRELIALRKNDDVLSGRSRSRVDGAVLAPEAFLLRYFGRDGDRLLLFNFGKQFVLKPMSEPLLAPPSEQTWTEIWCSEAVEYGGEAMAPLPSEDVWELPPHCAVVLRSNRIS